MPKIIANEPYIPHTDPLRPICRAHIQNKCRKGTACVFYHPTVITTDHQKIARRKLGRCYCGARQRTILNTKILRIQNPDPDVPVFYVVCSKTGKAMMKCYK